MRLLLVHNEYAKFSGEETIFYGMANLLRAHGHEVATFVRKSAELRQGLRGEVSAFFSGIWSRRAQIEFGEVCREFSPDVIHVQNLFPRISTSVLNVAKERGVPLVMSCHNYRLFCPTGLMLRDQRVCTNCVSASGREWNCVRHNCEGSYAKSLGYALRNRVARPRLMEAVHQFIVLSSFQADSFAEWGVAGDRLAIVPNFVGGGDFPLSSEEPGSGGYIGFVGRLSPEKGVTVLVEAARKLPHIRFELAGHAARVPAWGKLPENVVVRGEILRSELPAFYRRAKAIVVPSVWYEAFGLVVVEAMLQERPVIASRLGALVDIVQHGVTGMHVNPGDASSLAEAVAKLWEEPETADRMGSLARVRAISEYSAEKFYSRLIRVYDKAISIAGSRASAGGRASAAV